VALGLAAAFAAGAALLAAREDPPRILVFAFIVCGWVLAVSVHEFCHALVAWRAGDTTVAAKGYLTFDPLKYADPFTSIVLPVVILAMGGIGFPGGAVYLRQDLMRSAVWRSAASLAGPMGTLAVFAGLAIALGLSRGHAPGLAPALSFLAFLQATAFVLNLLPVPGLDGYGVIRPFLPQTLRSMLLPLERFAILAFMAAFFFWPPLAGLVFGIGAVICALGGIDFDQVMAGYHQFQFWK
jgi:Zn-dependent protease